MKFKRYIITEGDTLESIAQRFLGDISRAGELAHLNKLRYPFISRNPQEKLDTLLGSVPLTTAVSNGVILPVSSADPSIFPDNGLAFLRGVGGVQGQPFHDTLLILGTARGIGGQRPTLSPGLEGQTTFFGQSLPPGDSIVIDGALSHAYAAGTLVWGYPDQSTVTQSVVGAGDTILLPLDAGNSNTLSAIEGDLVAALGIDLALDPYGFLTLTNGEVALIEGSANIAQALRIRLTTYQGELPVVPDYGNAALDVLGQAGPDVGVRIYAAISQALLADPRVARVQSISLARYGDAILATAAVAIRDRDSVVAVNNLILSPQS